VVLAESNQLGPVLVLGDDQFCSCATNNQLRETKSEVVTRCVHWRNSHPKSITVLLIDLSSLIQSHSYLTGDHTNLLRAVWRMELDDSAETASSQVSKQDETNQDETLGLSSAAGKHSSYSNVILSQIMSSMEPSVQLPVGSPESMDTELGRT
jgi:hypothetical protein